MIEWILIVFLLLALAGMSFVAWRFYRKCVVYDEVFQYISDDVNTNISQFVKINKSVMLSNEPEVRTAHENMITMGRRLDEILNRMEEATGLSLRPPKSPPRPVVK
jgi:hypothetical protein